MIVARAIAVASLVFAGTASAAGVAVTPAEPAKDAPDTPSVATAALREEVAQNTKSHCATDDQLATERKELAAERSRLEKLVSEIARSREALRAETTRLETLVKQADARPGQSPAASASRSSEPAESRKASPPVPVTTHADLVARSMHGMKPDQAAAVLKKMNHVLAAKVVAQMKPADAAAVLGKLEPAEAAEILAATARGDDP